MTRDTYVADLTLKLLERIHDRVKASIRPQVDVEGAARQFEKNIQITLEKALNKSLDNLERRYLKYAEECIPITENKQFKQMTRSISRAEKDVEANFHEGRTGFVAGIGDIQRKLLKECFYDLVDNLDLEGTNLLDILHQEHIMSESDDRSIRAKTSARDKNRDFLEIICDKLSPEEFNYTFLPAVQKDHPHLFTKLVEKLSEMEESFEEKQCLSCRVRDNVQVHRLAKPLLKRKAIHLSLHADLCRGGLSNRCKWGELESGEVSHEDIIEALNKRYPNYHKQFKQEGRTSLECYCQHKPKEQDVVDYTEIADFGDVVDSPNNTPSEDPSTTGSEVEMRDVDEFVAQTLQGGNVMKEEEYVVRQGSGRGICLIINNIEFSTPRFRTRSGSEVDEDKLYTTFTRLGFLVVKERDLTSDGIRARILEFSKHTDHSGYDAFICCLLTHGNNNVLYGTDGASLPLSEITSEFTARQCPSLAGKPKIFFVQADRGKARMLGLKLPRKMSEAEGGDGEEAQIVADEADFLIGYCTPPGYASYRHRSQGSWYIKRLCEVLDSSASDNHDLLTNLVAVNSKIAGSVGHKKEKQVAAPMFTLTKSLFLTIDPSV
ncbi:caspase-10-like [Haliotis cracherodii]|uniref:caspase-10-like n=1 Tax=Haliotis cracherodii TaxID=6455 RepID=UPI0039ECD3C3